MAVALTKEQIVNYFILYLKDRYPELDLRVGTAVRDLVLEPIADLFQEFLNEVLRLSNFLTGDVQDEELLEKFLQNFFVTRKYGFHATGIVRVYVAESKIYRVPQGTKFYLSQSEWFETPEEFVIPESGLYYNSLENTWYFEVPVVASAVGTNFNVVAGTALEPEPFTSGVLKAEAAIDFTGGEDVEPISDFVSRAREALVTRNLLSARSLRTVLREQFSSLLKVVPIGFGDPEMWRDFKTQVNAHIGGHTDVWVKFKNKPVVKTVQVDSEGWLIDAVGMLRVLTPGVNVVEADPNTAFGVYPKVRVDVTDTTVEIECVPEVSVIQEFLDRSDSRVLTVNYMARAMVPVYLSGTVPVVLRPDVELASVQTGLLDWIYNVDEFTVSDMIDYLYNLGVEDVRLPLVITADVIGVDYGVSTLQVDDRFYISNKELSNRTVTFYDGGLTVVTA